MIYGYSERGVFNSIIYYLDFKRPDLIGAFLKKLGVDGFATGYEFTFLNEQSFSDFGDNDLTIIAKHNGGKKAVIFIEGKVKTFSGNFCLEKEFNKIDKSLKTGEIFDGFSSNIFVQMYYKFLLQEVLQGEETKTKNLQNIFKKKNKNGGREERSIGDNGIVLKACEMIKGANEFYYIALLPENRESKDLCSMFEKLNKHFDKPMRIENIRCAYWGKVEHFFAELEDATSVIKNFEYNEAKDKKGKTISQIYKK